MTMFRSQCGCAVNTYDNAEGQIAGAEVSACSLHSGAERDALTAERDRLREALRPFAVLIAEIDAAKVQPRDECLSLCEIQNDGGFWNHGHVNLNDLRTARAALSGKEGK